MTSLQTARTVPRGETQTTVGASYLRNDQRSAYFSNLPVDLMVRHGATEQVDWGVRLFFGLGLLGDVKWNLLPSGGPTALALSAGIGGAADPTASNRSAEVVHLPITATLSRAVTSWLTPYVAVGYGTYWIFDYGQRDPSQTYAARTGTGDSLLVAHVGVELARASGRALLIEYTYARPILDDPGDSYTFTANHFFSIGFHGGGRAGPDLFAR